MTTLHLFFIQRRKPPRGKQIYHKKTPKQMKRRLPAEWEPQSAIQLTWPHADTDWGYMLGEVQACYLNVAREISKRERLIIACKNKEEVEQQLAKLDDTCLKNISIHETDNNDTWARDHGGITVEDEQHRYSILDFRFNGWGMKFAANKDNYITKKLHEKGAFADNVRLIDHNQFVLEGGSIESDGKGTLLTTEECLLSLNRNEWMSKTEIEQYLAKAFGFDHFLWLQHGYLAGDDTDSHVDTLARLCDEQTIAYVCCEDTKDEHYNALKAMEDELKALRDKSGNPYRLIALPMADYAEADGERLPATYANFLIMNGAVLMPTYGTAKDELAKAQLAKAFPDREIVGINCFALIKQHGSLHCITMQYPEGVVK